MADTVSEDGDLVVGSTYRFRATITKDGVAWDLSAATVYMILEDPDGVQTTNLATVESPASAGIVHWDNATTDLNQAGDWRRCWEVQDGAVVQRSLPIVFGVVESP